MSGLKILYGYSWFASQAYGDVKEQSLAYFRRLNEAGFDVEGFCLTLNPPGPCLGFKDLDQRWRGGDKTLLAMYERLMRALEGKDVLINGPGINLHPEFVANLPVCTVFQCFDDPENSHNLSRPVAAAYDLCLVGNIAEVDTYRSWGVQHAFWAPMGLQPNIYDTTLTYEEVLNGKRDIDLFMMMNRSAPWRRERLDKLACAFPEAHFYGSGWARGFLPGDQELSFLRRAKVGPNIHNSTGPINYRTFYLPANGVLQICDNKGHLGEIYRLGEEAVGFDSIEECIDLCRYYLAHDEERRLIAANGWKRAMTDYNETAVFQRVIRNILSCRQGNEKERRSPALPRRATMAGMVVEAVKRGAQRCRSLVGPGVRKVEASPPQDMHARNVGDRLLEWPERAGEALRLAQEHLSIKEAAVADYGCGRQTLRHIIPAAWHYTPYDYCSRSTDTVICDFNAGELPRDHHDVIFCMGVLEYLDRPLELLAHALEQASVVVFSYNGSTTDERRHLQGWKNNLAWEEFDDLFCRLQTTVLAKKHLGNNEWIYLVKGKYETRSTDRSR